MDTDSALCEIGTNVIYITGLNVSVQRLKCLIMSVIMISLLASRAGSLVWPVRRYMFCSRSCRTHLAAVASSVVVLEISLSRRSPFGDLDIW